MVADELRRRADTFTDLMELRATVGRNSSERPPSRERGELHSPQFVRRTTAPRAEPDELIS
jgi:hypothetical protein